MRGGTPPTPWVGFAAAALRAVLCALILCALGACTSDRPDFDQVKLSVVRVLTQQVSGSGFIINAEGYIITNHHVVAQHNAALSPVRVMLLEGRDFLDADVIQTDPRRDLALLRIRSSKALAAIPLAETSDAVAGEQVWALGFPGIAEEGLRQDARMVIKITGGVISAVVTNRSAVASLQTDAEIFRGNSGGPLVNRMGALVGVNAWELSKFNPREGLLEKANYAVSVSEVQAFLDANGVAFERRTAWRGGRLWAGLASVAALCVAVALYAFWRARTRRARPLPQPPFASSAATPQQGARTPWLMIRKGERAGSSIPLSPGSQDIGRDGKQAAITFSSHKISRRHARITYPGGDFLLLEDMNSTNGVFVGGKRVFGQVRINSGDEFSLAGDELQLTFELR